jgi:hypothetical protein
MTVVSQADGPEAVRAYVLEHAARGVDHVVALIRADRAEMLSIIDGLTEAQAGIRPVEGEWCIREALQHLSGGFDRTRERILTMARGLPYESRAGVAGSLAPEMDLPFVELRRIFTEGSASVLAAMEGVEPTAGLDFRAKHQLYGDFNWLEFTLYSQHVHLHDHLDQIKAIRAFVDARS